MKGINEKISSLLLVLIMVVCCGTALPIPVMAGTAEEICEIVGGEKYTSVKAAVDGAKDGQHIRVFSNFTEKEPIEIDGKTIYFELGDFDLNIDTTDNTRASAALLVINGGSAVQLDSGSGRLNVSGARTGIYLFNAQEVVILNGDVVGNEFGLLAAFGGTITVNGNISGRGSAVSGTGDTSIAINGDIYGDRTGISVDNRAVINVNGNVTGGITGLQASTGAVSSINGNVTGGIYGVRSFDDATVTIDGNILADGDLHGSYGKIIAVGVEASEGGIVYVNGKISTIIDHEKDIVLPPPFIDINIDDLLNEAESSYIWFNSEPFNPKRVAETPYPPEVVIEGIRYYAYTHDDGSRVYIKIPSDEKEHGTGTFSDVSEDAWYFDAVGYVFEKSLMRGTATGIFSPDATLTRAMTVTILYRQAGKPEVSEVQVDFIDVAPGEWYTDAVKWAVSNGIVRGYGNGKFGANDAVTKEQLAALIYRTQQADGKIPPDILMDYEWSDWNSISVWARSAVNVLTIQGVFRDLADTSFNPKNAATRAEIACVLFRYLTAIE